TGGLIGVGAGEYGGLDLSRFVPDPDRQRPRLPRSRPMVPRLSCPTVQVRPVPPMAIASELQDRAVVEPPGLDPIPVGPDRDVNRAGAAGRYDEREGRDVRCVVERSGDSRPRYMAEAREIRTDRK